MEFGFGGETVRWRGGGGVKLVGQKFDTADGLERSISKQMADGIHLQSRRLFDRLQIASCCRYLSDMACNKYSYPLPSRVVVRMFDGGFRGGVRIRRGDCWRGGGGVPLLPLKHFTFESNILNCSIYFFDYGLVFYILHIEVI